jgi:glyoxylate carboligase
MTAIEAAVSVLQREGVDTVFGVPGAAINPLYAALRKRGSIRHISGAARRGRIAHGRWLYARQARQYRRVHRARPDPPEPT